MSRSPFFPSLESLPQTLPIFPLAGAVVMPGSDLPLNIFEPRYLHMVADALGFCLDDSIHTENEVAVATAPIDSPIGVIEPGLVAAQRFTWQGCVNGEPVIEAIVNWFMGDKHFDKPWGFGPQGPRYELEIKGDPALTAVYHGIHPATIDAGLLRNEGIIVTAMHCVNAIPYVCRAQPGIRSYLDLPMICGRAAPELVK